MSSHQFFDHLFYFFNKEEKSNSCEGISEEACEEVPRNYLLLILSNMFTKLAGTLSNPKTVLTWLMSYVNAPVYLISFIVPIRESGSMLPQIILSSFIQKKAIRKWVWVMGSVCQFMAIAGIGLVSIFFDGVEAGWLIVSLLVVFSVSRALCSISSKDVYGKAIPKSIRGTLKGYITSISGILILAAGLYIFYKPSSEADIGFYSSIIFFASALWLIAAIFYANIKEFPGVTISNESGVKDSFSKLSLLKKDTVFRNFIIARSLLLCTALSAPFYILLAQKYLGKESSLLGLFVIVNGLASIISAPFWGKLSDKYSHKVMAFAALIASSLGLVVFLVVNYAPSLNQNYWFYPAVLFILGIAHSGARLGRKTYVINIARGNKRTDYVSVGNTLIGFILLITGGITALVSHFSLDIIIVFLSVLGALGAFISFRLPKVN